MDSAIATLIGSPYIEPETCRRLTHKALASFSLVVHILNQTEATKDCPAVSRSRHLSRVRKQRPGSHHGQTLASCSLLLGLFSRNVSYRSWSCFLCCKPRVKSIWRFASRRASSSCPFTKISATMSCSLQNLVHHFCNTCPKPPHAKVSRLFLLKSNTGLLTTNCLLFRVFNSSRKRL